MAEHKKGGPSGSWVLLVSLIIAAFLGNYFAVTLFFGAELLFGSIAVMLILRFFGTGWGVLAAALASTYTYCLWHHPYAIFTFGLEALFVGFFLRSGRRNPVLLDGLFWLLVGTPVNWLFYDIVMRMGPTAASFIMLKQSLNGVFNALAASLAISFLPFHKLTQGSRSRGKSSLFEIVFNLLVAFVLLPALLSIVLEGRKETARMEKEAAAELQVFSSDLGNHLLSWYRSHKQAVSELARLGGQYGVKPSEKLQHDAEIICNTFPGFHIMYVADAEGTTVAFHPPVNERGEPTIGLNYSDRGYFQQLRSTRKPVTTEVFVGRGAVFSPVAAIVVPVPSEDQFAGFALGGVDLSGIRQLIEPYGKEGSLYITITDPAGLVIASTMKERASMQALDLKKGSPVRPDTPVYQRFPDDEKFPSVVRWSKSFYVLETVLGEEIPWKVIIEASVAPHQMYLFTLYVRSFAIMGGFVVLAFLLAAVLARWLSGQLSQLARTTENLSARLMEPHGVDWPESPVAEICLLVSNFQSVASALRGSFMELHRRSTEQERVNEELRVEVVERRKAEEALEAARARLHYLLTSTPVVIYAAEPTGSHAVTFVSENVSLQLGHEPRRLVYNPGFRADLIHPEDLPRVLESLSRLGERNHCCLAYRLRGKDGKYYWIHDAARLVRDSQGSPMEIVGSWIDITERKEMEEQLGKRERQLADAQRIARLGSWDWDVIHDTSVVSDELVRLFGVEPGQFASNSCKEYMKRIHPEDRAFVSECVRKALAGERPFSGEYRIVRPDGSERTVYSEGEVIRGESSEPVAMVGFHQDVTERRKAQDVLEESEQRFRSLVESSLTGVFIIQDGRIVYHNPELERIIGPQIREGKFASFDCFHVDDVKKVLRFYRAVMSGEHPAVDGDFRFYPSGKMEEGVEPRWAYCRASLIEYRGKEAILTNMMDITCIKELEHLLRMEDRMSSLGRVAAGIAHELRNPLSGLNIYVTNLERTMRELPDEDPKMQARVAKILAHIKSASGRIEQVVKRVMDFAKPSMPRMAPVDVNRCIEGALDLSRAVLRKSGIVLEKSLHPAPPRCHADPHLMEQAFLNLITNAIHMMQDVDGPRRLGVSSSVDNGRIHVKVSDSGPGVPSHLRGKVFDPFFTTQKDGIGIGLSLCRRIISDHGGTLRVTTSKWGGAEFTAEIPIAKRREAP